MSLPFLPAEQVEDAFNHLKKSATTDAFQKLIKYIQGTWIRGFYEIATWNMFMVPTRTNNDCEGWHRRVNVNAWDGSLPFYTLVPLLHEEAGRLPLQRLMVSEGTLCSLQRRQTKRAQSHYFSLWDSYNNGEITAGDLMAAVA
jgi:hypothetical protein